MLSALSWQILPHLGNLPIWQEVNSYHGTFRECTFFVVVIGVHLLSLNMFKLDYLVVHEL